MQDNNKSSNKFDPLTFSIAIGLVFLAVFAAAYRIFIKRYGHTTKEMRDNIKLQYHDYLTKKTDTAPAKEERQYRLLADSTFLEAVRLMPEQVATFSGIDYVCGDRIGKYEIVDIREDQVVLSDGDKIYYMELGRSLGSLR